MSAAQSPGRAYFFPMPSDDELRKQAIERPEPEMRRMLIRVLFRLRADLVHAEEKGDAKTVQIKQEQIGAAERSLARLTRKRPEI